MKPHPIVAAMAVVTTPWAASAQHDHSGHSQSGDTPTESEARHIAPEPPQTVPPPMSEAEMVELMGMDDTHPYWMLQADHLEWRDAEDEFAWDAHAWYGNDHNKLWLKTEGEQTSGQTEGRLELLWDRIIARWWSAQAGWRNDFGSGPSRDWAAIGIQGLAPYWFETEATLYVGEEGRTALRLSGEYELLLTQRLIAQPEIELNAYGKSDSENGIGSGVSDLELALRLRYEIKREFAPYVGVVWTRLFGGTRDIARQEGHDADEVQVVAGLRVWF